MLDDVNVIKQRDSDDALGIASLQYKQTQFIVDLKNEDNDGRPITSIIIAGMGGSALAALLVKTWLSPELSVPIEVVRSYDLPEYAGYNTLVIAYSYSGNTEETLSCLDQAVVKSSQIAIIASGGELVERANELDAMYALLPSGIQPRMGMIYGLRALIAILVNFGVVPGAKLDEIASKSDWLRDESAKWVIDVPADHNYAKQLALQSVGKTAVFFGGEVTAPVAYKWKISWNENAKNVSFWNQLPEFDHNEFIGWTSHPIEKPFAVFDLVSPLEHPQILKRFEVSDRLLSGMRPKSTVISMKGDSIIEQMLWGCILADFVSIYLAILNGVNPTPVPLIEKLKQELG